VGDVGVELVVERLADADRNAARHDVDARAAAVAELAQLIDVRLDACDVAGVGGEEGVLGDVLPALERNRDVADRGEVAGKRGPAVLAQPFLGDRRRADRRCRQPCRRATTAARVAQAVFVVVRVVGVAGPERIEQVRVVLAALVGVADQERDRRPGRLPSKTPERISTLSLPSSA
jgi:hypothetical protein